MPNDLLTPAFSICIPAYDMHGRGAEYLGQSLDRLKRQTYTDFEVVVSDQSDNDAVRDVCFEYAGRLQIKHVFYRGGPRQSSANTNHAMRHASGAILKILFQDDYLCDDTALEQMARAFEDPSVKWLLCGSAVTRDGKTLQNHMVPRMNANIHLGRNTVSSPSVLALVAGTGLEFDEALIWLMDGEFYRRCAEKLGPPHILRDTLVANRLHEGQVSAEVSKELRRNELIHVRRTHYAQESLGNRLHYYKQRLKAR